MQGGRDHARTQPPSRLPAGVWLGGTGTAAYGGLKPGVAYCSRGKTYIMYVQGWDQQLEVILADRSNGRVNERVMMISLLDKNKGLAADNSALRAELARLQQTA